MGNEISWDFFSSSSSFLLLRFATAMLGEYVRCIFLYQDDE